ncbi:hypothetical protein [Microbacterium proteolyticum]|uniref:hypothetical protein n=1 Tax=Microbacterium proteolyticum TaxID=1572644 RepID=UPI0035BED27E
MAVFAVFLVAQGVYSFRVSPEPYPVIRMPGFQTASTAQGIRTVSFVEGTVDFADGTSAEVNPATVMDSLRFSTARPSLDYVFGPSESRHWSPELLEWLRTRVQAVTGRTDASGIRFCWQSATVDIHDASVTDDGACEWTEVKL